MTSKSKRPFASLTAFAFSILFTTILLVISLPLQASSITFKSAGKNSKPTGNNIATNQSPQIYIIQLQDNPIATYQGDIAELSATNPATTGASRLSNTRAVEAYHAFLINNQQTFIQSAEFVLGHSLKINFQYQHAFNGFAVELTASEANLIAQLDNVVSIYQETVQELLTDAGPAWMGAPSVWDGSANGLATMGEGIVIAVLDSGINSDHPSFADIGGDGYDHINPLGDGKYLGVCDSTNPDYQPDFACNDKLIGVHDFIDGHPNDPDSPEDSDGHGSHVASIVAGNIVTANLVAPTYALTDTISGVAPHANIIAYDVCRGGCPDSLILAAVNQVISDSMVLPNGIAALNLSITGGNDPYNDPIELAFLAATEAGIFVSAGAENSGPTAGSVGHISPWVSTVGASTHNRKMLNQITHMEGGSNPPAIISGLGLSAGYGSAEIVYAGDYTSTETVTPALCGVGSSGDYNSPWPPDTFDGEIVVCDRGGFGRVEKGANVLAAGAGGYILIDNGSGVLADPHVLPGLHISEADGAILKSWLISTTVQTATISGLIVDVADANGDILAWFSSRGPAQNLDVLKPDITAPGFTIWGAAANGSGASSEFFLSSGTSMSAPHNAGAAALLAAVHPDWSPHQIKSALMMSAYTGENLYKEDGVTLAAPFDVGAGRIDLYNAANAGLVMDETMANFAEANPDLGGDVTLLNIPSLSDWNCYQGCVWTRTVESTRHFTTTWSAYTESPSMTLQVEPTQFKLASFGSQMITVTAVVSGLVEGEWRFGTVWFEEVTQQLFLPLIVTSGSVTETLLLDSPTQQIPFDFIKIPDAHWPVAVYPVASD